MDPAFCENLARSTAGLGVRPKVDSEQEFNESPVALGAEKSAPAHRSSWAPAHTVCRSQGHPPSATLLASSVEPSVRKRCNVRGGTLGRDKPVRWSHGWVRKARARAGVCYLTQTVWPNLELGLVVPRCQKRSDRPTGFQFGRGHGSPRGCSALCSLPPSRLSASEPRDQEWTGYHIGEGLIRVYIRIADDYASS